MNIVKQVITNREGEPPMIETPTPPKPRIQVATLDHVSQITELVNSAYRGETGAKGWTTEASILSGLRTDDERTKQLIEQPNSVVLVKLSNETSDERSDEVEGCVHLEKKNETTAYLGMLSTNVHQQTKGTGSALMLAAEEFVKRVWQVKDIEMTVIELRHELISYYVRRGYHVTEEKRPFPDDPRFGVSMVGPFEFVVLKKQI